MRNLEEEQERRRREERSREERRRQESGSLLDLAQLVRQEVQRAFLTLLPPAVARGPPGPQL